MFFRTHFFNMLNTKDNFNFAGFAAKGITRCIIEESDDDGSQPHYNFNYDNVGTFYNNNRFISNKLAAPLHANNNIPTSCFIDDITDRSSIYQSITNAVDQQPTWVGTPIEGQVCTVYNPTTGHAHNWCYRAAAWAQMT
jgi:hypothetical protein